MFRTEKHRHTRAVGRDQRGAAWLDWLILLVGIGLTTSAGGLAFRSWLVHSWTAVFAAALVFTCGALLAVMGMRSHRARIPATDMVTLRSAVNLPVMMDTDGLPRLGELLVYKHHLISERDLRKALARQTETGKRLGEVLVDMGRVTWLELARVLEDQFAYGDPWKVR